VTTTVLCPSRGRPDAAWAVKESLEATRQDPATRLVFILDEDDATLADYMRPRNGRELMIRRPRHEGGMVNALNAAALDLLVEWPHERVVGFVGDDHRFRTPGWDEVFNRSLEERPGFVYGNDLFWRNGEIPTQIFISTEIVRALGWMALPACRHLYVDNAWMELGRETGSIRYYDDVVIEHMHPAAGKAAWDEGHLRVNSEAMYNSDAAAFATWRESEAFHDDVRKVIDAIVR
jgi:hypothetical protein